MLAGVPVYNFWLNIRRWSKRFSQRIYIVRQFLEEKYILYRRIYRYTSLLPLSYSVCINFFIFHYGSRNTICLRVLEYITCKIRIFLPYISMLKDYLHHWGYTFFLASTYIFVLLYTCDWHGFGANKRKIINSFNVANMKIKNK